MGAYAGFQGWDLLCRHASGPIELAYGIDDSGRRQAIYPYGIGMDPMRVQARPLRRCFICAVMCNWQKSISVCASRLSMCSINKVASANCLMTSPVWANNRNRSGLAECQGGAAAGCCVRTRGRSTDVYEQTGPESGAGWRVKLPAVLADLRKRGILAGNQSDGKNYFESDSGEILLDADARVLKVITPRTEAAAFAKAPGKLNTLNVRSASEPALVSASSLDGAALEKSRRILLVLASDARNSGMQFTGRDDQELVRLGGMPILLRSIRVELGLKHDHPADLSLYALRLNGERGQQIPVTVFDGTSVALRWIRVRLRPPTTYFELVEK